MIKARVINGIVYVDVYDKQYDWDIISKVQDTLQQKYPEYKISIITK